MTRHINETGLAALKQWEGKRLNAYQDSAGVWTIGYGHTCSAGSPQVEAGLTITDAQAEEILKRDLTQYESAVEYAVKVPLNDNQFAVLVSFCYNVGVAAFKRSTLLRKLNMGHYEAIPAELMKWINCRGERLQGLVNRRSAEAGLWAKGAFVSSGTVSAAAKQENALVKPEMFGPVIGALAGAGGMLSGTGPVQWALAVVMVVSCLVGAWYFIRRIRNEAA